MSWSRGVTAICNPESAVWSGATSFTGRRCTESGAVSRVTGPVGMCSKTQTMTSCHRAGTPSVGCPMSPEVARYSRHGVYRRHIHMRTATPVEGVVKIFSLTRRDCGVYKGRSPPISSLFFFLFFFPFVKVCSSLWSSLQLPISSLAHFITSLLLFLLLLLLLLTILAGKSSWSSIFLETVSIFLRARLLLLRLDSRSF